MWLHETGLLVPKAFAVRGCLQTPVLSILGWQRCQQGRVPCLLEMLSSVGSAAEAVPGLTLPVCLGLARLHQADAVLRVPGQVFLPVLP